MVGVPKSTGCLVCRKRKIKCDETWPTCINCRKNGKLCPGPPARHTFKDLRPQLHNGSRVIDAQKHDVAQGQESQKKLLTHINAKYTDTGAVVLKYRLSRTDLDTKEQKRTTKTNSTSVALPDSGTSPLGSPVTATLHERLSRALVEVMESEVAGYGLSAFGSFMYEVPRRIGHNAALDAAAACLMHTRSTAFHTRPLEDLESPRLYLAAVRKLQACLDDPTDGTSSNTLGAAVLLSLVEALAGPRIDNAYLAHVGGAGRLLEVLGPGTCRDEFAKEILRFTRGGIIVTSMYKSRPCFLLSQEWRDIAFDSAEVDLDESLYTDVLKLLAELSVLLKGRNELSKSPMPTFHPPGGVLGKQHYPEDETVKSYLDPDFNIEMDSVLHKDSDAEWLHPRIWSGPEVSTQHTNEPYLDESHVLLTKAYALKGSLCSKSTQLTTRLSDLEHDSAESDSPVATSYQFTHWRTARIYTIYWSLCILVNKFVANILPPSDPYIYSLETECRTVALEICKTWENAWANRPIGASQVWLGFVVAYEYCDEHVRRWILSALNRLLDDQGVREWRWTGELMEAMNKRLMGEGDALDSMGVM